MLSYHPLRILTVTTNISHELLALKTGDNPVETSEEQERLSALNSQLDEVLYQLRQLEIN